MAKRPQPKLTQVAQAVRNQGRDGDSELVHINPQEKALLDNMAAHHGGAAGINPLTGLPEYNIFGDIWDGIVDLGSGLVNAVKKAAPIIVPAVAIFCPAVIPMIGTALGASGAAATALGVGALSAGVTAISGGSIKQILTAGVTSAAFTALTPIVGSAVTPTGTSAALASMAGSAALGAGVAAIQGANWKQIVTAAANGAASNYLGQVAAGVIQGSSTGVKLNSSVQQSMYEDSVFAAADAEQLAKQGMSKNQISQILRASGINDAPAMAIATEAVSGKSATDIAVTIANKYSGSAYLYKVDPQGSAVILGNNQDAYQKAENQNIVANMATEMKAQGMSTKQIELGLQNAGVDATIAKQAAGLTTGNFDAKSIANYIAYDNPNITNILGNTPSDAVKAELARYDDAAFIAHDVAQLAKQGLKPADIAQNLIGAGVDPAVAKTISNWGGYTEAQLNQLLTGSSFTKTADLFNPDNAVKPTAPVETPTQPTAPTTTTPAPSNRIPVYDETGNMAYFDPAENKIYSAGTGGNVLADLNAPETTTPPVETAQTPTTPEPVAPTPEAPTTPAGPAGTIAVYDSNGNLGYYNPETNQILDAKGTVLADMNQAPVSSPVDVAGPYRVEVSGIPVTDQMSAADQQAQLKAAIPEGTRIANQDTQGAYYDTASNAWVVQDKAEITQPIVPVEIPEQTKIPEVQAGPTTPIAAPAPVEPPVQQPTGGQNNVVASGPPTLVSSDKYGLNGTRYVYSDGSAYVKNPYGDIYQTQTTGGTYVSATKVPGLPQTPAPTTTTTTNPVPVLNPNPIVNPSNPNAPDNIDVGGGYNPGTGTAGPSVPVAPPLTPPVQQVVPETPKIPEVVVPTEPPLSEPKVEVIPDDSSKVTPVEVPTEPPVLTPPEVGGIVGMPPTIPTVTPPAPTTTPYDLHWGQVSPLVNPGLNPGWIQGVPHYQTTSPYQAQFYWGQHPYQPGPTFDPALYNQVNAPAQPWGLQQGFTPMTQAQLAAMIAGPIAPGPKV